MYIASKYGKLIHCNQCRHAKAIHKENRLNFPHFADAAQQGYTLAPCCVPTVRGYQRQKKRIETLCAAYGMTLSRQGPLIYLSSNQSDWLIDTDSDGRLQLFHQNTELRAEDAPTHPGYHLQRCSASSLLQMLLYIVNHDAFRTIHPLTKAKATRRRKPAPPELPGQMSLFA